MMQCPCCGNKIKLGASGCGCGSRFVGEPFDETPIKIQRLGPAMLAVLLLAVFTGAALVFTKFLALGAIAVVWASRRAMKLARRDPAAFGGYRTAAATLVVTVAAGAVASGYAISYVPQFLENRRTRQIAATRAAMHHMANLLEDYKRIYGTYPRNMQLIKEATKEQMPSDFWKNMIRYQSSAALADSSLGRTGIPFTNFELRSAGPDEIEGTDDDVIMRDGLFFTNSETLNNPIGRDSIKR